MLTLSTSYHDPDFELRLTVGSGDQQESDIHFVEGYRDPCPEFGPGGGDTTMVKLKGGNR